MSPKQPQSENEVRLAGELLKTAQERERFKAALILAESLIARGMSDEAGAALRAALAGFSPTPSPSPVPAARAEDAAKAATLAERERCAKGCEDFAKGVRAALERHAHVYPERASAREETALHLAKLIRETGNDADALPTTTEGA